jgi:8-oxo-dGTP pyrophosphatase MutT (NUDIX family)
MQQQQRSRKGTSPSSAGILLLTGEGQLVLGKHDKGLTDFGGKREAHDADSWATAQRECTEEVGITVPSTAILGHVDVNRGKHRIYVCQLHDLHADTQFMIPIEENAIHGVYRMNNPQTMYSNMLHPRLMYNTMEERQAILALFTSGVC